jgi:hypothetical protein
MRWLVVLGVSLDLAGALLVASAVIGQARAETREELTPRWGLNLWALMFRERERALVLNGVVLIVSGFLLQLVGYLWDFDSWWPAGLAAVGTVAAGFGVTWWWAGRHVPLKYHAELDLPEGIEDERHHHHLRTKEEIRTWWELWASRMLDSELVESDEIVQARIAGGDWQTVSCPHCPSEPMPAWPENERAFCPVCGVSYLVEFPDQWREIERLPLERSTTDRNWEPWQTVDDLRRENRENEALDLRAPAP